MHSTAFKTDLPLGPLMRALDELSRAGFSLNALSVSAARPPVEVRIDYSGPGTIPAEVYVARLSRLPGVFAVQGGPVVEG